MVILDDVVFLTDNSGSAISTHTVSSNKSSTDELEQHVSARAEERERRVRRFRKARSALPRTRSAVEAEGAESCDSGISVQETR